jgi:ABC-type multidrug transport system ATPase subunit
MISARSVGKAFGSTLALDGISFDVARGDCLGFTGAPGSGRTTLLRILGTLVRHTSGTLLIDGLDSATDAREIRRRVVLVSLDWNFGERLRTSECVSVLAGARLAGNRREQRAGIRQALARAGLDDGAMWESLGRNQRAALALTAGLIVKPLVLLLDDPFRFIDDETRIVFTTWLDELRGAGTTIVLGASPGDSAAPLCQRVIHLERGRIVAERAPRPAVSPENR